MILEIANDIISKLKNDKYRFGIVDYPNIQEWEWNTGIYLLREETGK